MTKPLIKINFVGFWHSNTEEDIKRNFLYRLLFQKYRLELSKKPDFLIYSTFDNHYLKYDNCIRIFYTGENIRPDFKHCDYAFSFDPTSGNNFRLPLYIAYSDEFEILKSKMTLYDIIENRKKKFCAFVISNPNAKERIEFYQKLTRYKKVDSGGRALNNIGGPVKDKQQFLKDYKFSIAFENTSYPSYTTEKIVQAFAAGTIPIYWGNPNIAKEFHSDAFINCHDYTSFDQVIEQVIAIDQNERLYRQMLNAPIFAKKSNEYIPTEAQILDRFEHIFASPKKKYLFPYTIKGCIRFYVCEGKAILIKARNLCYRIINILRRL